MDAEDKAVFRRIADGVDSLVAAIPKPESNVMRVFEIAATIAGAAGVIAIADTVVGWFK
ncbi:hypothetical protein AGMMS49944_28620 [Spirochaetia bacterium]|nr:hypothetical protein AGMMS49944_28620 [Spirochaetia bacterium]